MFLSLSKTKKIIAGFILLVICSGISIPVFWPAPKASAFSYGDVITPSGKVYKGPVVSEEIAKKMKDSGNSGGIGTKISEAAMEAANAILSGLAWFAAKIIAFEASILNWILNPDNFRLATAPIVKTGWDATRTTVNMFFILALLIVAFATILRIETYNVKQVLPYLIIVALLINFSLVIAGAILDFANVMTSYFYQSLGKDSSDIAAKLQNGLKITNFFAPNEKPDEKVLEGLLTGITGLMLSFVSLLIGVVFLMATIFIFAALIAMMLIRILYIWILLILAPAAWFFYILPAYRNLWFKWWSTFFRWAFFAPIAMFFIYLSITTLDNMPKRTIDQTGVDMIALEKIGAKTTAGQKDLTRNPVEAIFQFFLGTGLILGSLMVANSMSITGADIATKLGKSGAKGIGAWAGRRAQVRTAKWSGAIGDKLDKTWVGKTWGVRQLVRPFQRYAESGRVYEKQLEGKYKGGSTEYLTSLHGKVDDPKKRAIESTMAERGQLDKILTDPEKVDQAVKRAYKGGNIDLAKSIIKFDPNSADKNRIGKELLNKIMGDTINNVDDVIKTLKPKDWVNMKKESFGTLAPQLLENTRSAHISLLAQEGKFSKLDQIEKATGGFTKSELSEKNAGIVNYFDSQAGQGLITPKYKPSKEKPKEEKKTVESRPEEWVT
ncbi:MAG: hypothetical protein Q8L57_01615 [bacterium]|nr:hypothetical protein [bacterium]